MSYSTDLTQQLSLSRLYLHRQMELVVYFWPCELTEVVVGLYQLKVYISGCTQPSRNSSSAETSVSFKQ